MAYVKHVLDEVYGTTPAADPPPRPRWPRVTVAVPGETGGPPLAAPRGPVPPRGAAAGAAGEAASRELREVELAAGAGRPPPRPPLHPSTPEGRRSPHSPQPMFIRCARSGDVVLPACVVFLESGCLCEEGWLLLCKT